MKNKSYRELIVYTTFGYIFDVKMFFYARNGTFEIRFDESRSSVYFDLRFRLRSYVCQGHPTTVSCNICWEEQTLPRLFYYFSLRSRRLEVVGKRENGRARGRHACLLLARPFFLVPTQFQAPATAGYYYLWTATNVLMTVPFVFNFRSLSNTFLTIF